MQIAQLGNGHSLELRKHPTRLRGSDYQVPTGQSSEAISLELADIQQKVASSNFLLTACCVCERSVRNGSTHPEIDT